MRVEEIMTKDVVFLSPDNTVAEAIRIFAENKIGGAPVIDEEGKLVGIVTDADIFKSLGVRYKKFDITFPTGVGMTTVDFKSKVEYKELKRAFHDAAKTRIRDIMVKKVLTADPGHQVEMIVPLLVEKKINRLPVVKGGQVVGLISRGDIIRALLME